MKLTLDTLRLLKRHYLTPEDAVFLQLLSMGMENSWDLDSISGRIEKLESIGLVSRGTLTSYGLSLIDSLSPEQESWEVNHSYTEEFNVFWKTFPSTDGFGNFPATRTIRTGKKDSFREWLKLLKEGYTASQIVNALQREIEARKSSSTFKGGNNLKFIKSPINYLKNKCFLDYEEEEENDTFEDNGSNYA